MINKMPTVSQHTASAKKLHPFQTDDPRLQPIHDKVMAQERLSADDALTLYRTGDILAIGWLANHVRERMHGDVAYFNVNRHINYTNVCVAACRLCAFGRKKDSPGSYTMALEEVWSTAAFRLHRSDHGVSHRWRPACRPAIPVLRRSDRGLKRALPAGAPQSVHHGEIAFFAKIGKMTPREVLVKFKEAGLDSMPGGGAEIFSDRIRHIICDHKIDGDDWLELARTAHEVGLKSNATMLYGHVENDEDRVDHLLKLRALQDDTHGFQTFIPLAFHPDNTPLQHLPKTTGMLDLKQIAVSRLVLDNFPHIKSYWQMVTPKMAQITLRFGADDIDGTVVEEKIYHDAGATTPQMLRRQDLIRLITEAGRVPFERDTLYRPVTRTETTVTVAV